MINAWEAVTLQSFAIILADFGRRTLPLAGVDGPDPADEFAFPIWVDAG